MRMEQVLKTVCSPVFQRAWAFSRPAPGPVFEVGLLLLALAACQPAAQPPTSTGPDASFDTKTIEDVGSQPFAVAAADFSRDGILDLAVTDPQSNRLVVLKGKGDGTFSEQLLQGWTFGRTGKLPRGLAVADFNRDGAVDAVVASTHSDEATLLLNDGGGLFPTTKGYKGGARPFAVAVGDVNEDGHADVVMANETNVGERRPGTVDVFLGNGSGELEPHQNLTAGQFPADVQVADLTGDRHLDIVVANWGSRDATVFLGDGKGSFRAGEAVKPDGGAPYSVQVADMNSDGKPDLVLSDLSSPTAAVMFGDGKGRFHKGPHAPTERGCRSLAVADFNGDGRLDVASANTNADSAVVSLAKPDGTFSEGKAFPVGKLPRWVTAADLNGDGRPDLVVTNLNSRSATVLINTTPFPR